MTTKIVTAGEAARLVRPGDTITTSGFVGIGVPDGLLAAIAERFAETGEPSGLMLVFAAGQGDGKERGLNRLGQEGLLARVVGGHWGLIPKVGKLALDGKLEAWNLPQGCISHLFREIAAGKPGLISRVGLETFVDPRQGGGAINARSTDQVVELMELGGETFLFYKAMPIHIALLRGTTADEVGNVTMEREALVLDGLHQAMAARNSGGLTIVQVERIAQRRTLPPREVVIPGALVDAVVVAEPEHHVQTYATGFSEHFTNRHRAPASAASPMVLDLRKVIARRCAFELPVNGVVNLGIGMPEGIAGVAQEEGLLEHMTLTAEPGVVGGQPASGLDFGAAVNTDAVITQNAQFDFYDGGGLDMACLGLAQADGDGNVNVSRFGGRLAGAGGFINISQNAKRLIFAGTFTAGGLEATAGGGRLTIGSEGKAQKFLDGVEQITFSGARAARLGQPVIFVTERCVFELVEGGLALTEIAPGVDAKADVLDRIGFAPAQADPVLMDERIFREEPMGLMAELLHLDLDDRVQLDPEANRLFLNFSKMRIRTEGDVARIRERVEAVLEDAEGRPDVIVNYDRSRIAEEIADHYAQMVAELEETRYGAVSRYSGSAFLRMKLGQAFSRRLQPNVFETHADAQAFLDRVG